MDNREALKRILKEEDLAEQAYEGAYSDSQQANAMAENQLRDQLGQAEIDAKKEAAQLWTESQERIDEELANLEKKDPVRNRLSQANANLDQVAQKIIAELLEEKL